MIFCVCAVTFTNALTKAEELIGKHALILPYFIYIVFF